MHERSVQKIKSKFKNRFMKKIIIGLVSLVNILAVSANGNVPVSEKVQQSFEKEFVKATNLNWEAKDKNVFHATFTYNGSQVEANFDGEGNLLSTVRLITEYQLPVMIVKTLSRDYGQYKIRRAQECNNNNDTHYLVTIYNNTESISLKFFSNGDEQRISRTKNIN